MKFSFLWLFIFIFPHNPHIQDSLWQEVVSLLKYSRLKIFVFFVFSLLLWSHFTGTSSTNALFLHFKSEVKTLINDNFTCGMWDCFSLLAGPSMKYLANHLLKLLQDVTSFEKVPALKTLFVNWLTAYLVDVSSCHLVSYGYYECL